MAAAATYWHWPEPVRAPLWLIVTGVCAAGTSKLGLLKAIRIGYPLSLVLPTMIALLATLDQTNAFAFAAALLFLIYVFDAGRMVRNDYWAAAVARFELEKREREFRELSSTDAPTKIANRRSFDERLASEWANASSKRTRISVLIIDIDHFKHVNDVHGHDVGDLCLIEVAAALKSTLSRPSDLVARYGGEEFAALLPDINTGEAVLLAEQMRPNVAKIHMQNEGKLVSLTCSIGVCTALPSISSLDPSLMKHADRALYRAKGRGRNCVFVFNDCNRSQPA